MEIRQAGNNGGCYDGGGGITMGGGCYDPDG